MRTIWKFTLALAEEFALDLPLGARILTAQLDEHGIPQLWVEVDSEQPTVSRRFRTFGTGGGMPDHLGAHVATFQVVSDGETSVLHLYEAD